MKKILLILIAVLSIATLNSCFKVVADEFTVTFNSNGGSTIPEQKVEKGKTATRPANPEKPGWDFANWYSDETLKTIYTFTEAVEEDITLYAKWEEKHVELQTMVNDVALADNFVNFNAARKEKENKQTEFYNRDLPFLVGIDNPFVVLPAVSFVKYNPATGEIIPTTVDEWTYDIKLSVKRGEAFEALDAENDFVEAIDNKKCTIDFTKNAVDSTFIVEVTPQGLTEKQLQNVESYTMKFEFKVTEGYNVYTAKELAYVNKRTDPVNGFWNEYKKANGLKQDYAPDKIILQNSLEILAKDLPAHFFYEEGDENLHKGDSDYDRALGSLKDGEDLYRRELADGDTFTLEGNYFSLDFSGLREVVRESGSITPEGAVFSHTQLFFFDGNNKSNTNVVMNNIYSIGNAPKVEDTVKAGGTIFVKFNETGATVTNSINTCNFITYFPNNNDVVVNVKDCKGYDAYNCFFYVWGGNLNVEHSEMVGAGGPVIIQDHTHPDAVDGGRISTSIISEDSHLESFVAGSEGWFVKVGASSLIATQIKPLDELFNPFGRSFLQKSKKDETISFLNFVVLNKSGNAQGMTSEPIKGNVRIGGHDFNYGKDNPYLSSLIYIDKESPLKPLLAAPKFETNVANLNDGIGYGTYDGLFGPDAAQIVNSANKIYAGDYIAMYYNYMMCIMGYFPAGQSR